MAIQQGDVRLVEVNLPKEAKEEDTHNKEIILARGEATGHAHRVANPEYVKVFKWDEKTYLKVMQQTQIIHEEHLPIPISEGVYEVKIIREYDHFAEESKPVED